MNSPNKYYLGNQSFDLNDQQEKEKLQLRIKNLLLLRNVNFLFGNGASLALGAPSISSMKKFVEQLKNKFENSKTSEKYAYEKITKTMEKDYESGFNFLVDFSNNLETDIDFETALSILFQISYTSSKISINANEHTVESIDSSIKLIKGFIFYSCKNFIESIDYTSLNSHREFIRKALLRQTGLPRLKIFTTNYDLIIEKCLDESGVFYFDGFVGSFEKRLRSESYNYDLYYPGEITEGNVNRVDRVVQLYKLHGSLNWKRVYETSENISGIKQEYPSDDQIGDLVIYPSTLKYGETLGYPYSEMFRFLSASLFRPQTALFTFGYSFKDEHINRLIYQALSIPTFNLIIVLPEGKEKNLEGEVINKELARLIETVGSNRIIVISGGEMKNGELIGTGTFKGFVDEIMPDMEEMRVQEKINDEIDKLFPKRNENGNKKSITTENRIEKDQIVELPNEEKPVVISKPSIVTTIKKIFTKS
jgi:hypothetical protein